MTPRILVWFWSAGGGGSQFAVNLAARLTEEFGQDQVSLSMRADDPTITRAEEEGVRVLAAEVISHRTQPFATALEIGRSASVLRAHIERARADIVCVAMNFAVAAPLSITLSKPLIYCAHDPSPHPGDLAVGLQRVTQAALIHRARTVLALSDFSANALARRAGSKLRMVPLSAVFRPRLAPVRAGDEAVRLLLPGRMISYKGVDLLCDALDRLADRHDWRLTVAGAGPSLTNVALERLRARPQVTLVRRGALSEADIDGLYAASDIVLAPYTSASQSGVVAQALAWGRPCVVTPVGALAEQVADGQAGWIAQAATPHAFSAALSEMLDNPVQRVAKAEGARAVANAAWGGDHWGWLARNHLLR